MKRKILFSAKLRGLGALLLTLFMVPALFAHQDRPPRGLECPECLNDLGVVELVSTPAVNTAALQAKHILPPSDGRVKIAEPYEVFVTPQTHGLWDVLPDGSRVWRIRVASEGATDINLGFTQCELPRGATLYVYSADYAYYQGPYTTDHAGDAKALWTPVIPGDTAVVELSVPADADGEPTLFLTRINRGFSDPFQLAKSGLAKQGSCNNDVVCPVGNPWRNQVKSTAQYTIDGLWLCTGTLIADVPRSYRDYFLTAYHCGTTPLNASSTVVYWNYQSPVCGQLGGGNLNQNQSGANYRAGRQDADFVLLELTQSPPATFDVYYSGWDRRGVTPTQSVCIHHPAGEEKAISFDYHPPSVVANCIYAGGPSDTHWLIGGWDDGTTESGSSGAGLWDGSSKLLIGVLSGGTASCGNPSGIDCFGRFSAAWDGPSPFSRLRDWLDPNATGAQTLSGSPPPHLSTLAKVVPGDYDGDHAADIGIYDPNSALWTLIKSVSGTEIAQFGFGNVVPANADYDGDGVVDMAVFHAASGMWYIQQSQDGYRSEQFGFGGVVPVPRDYDGDGRADLAVFHAASGNWYRLKTTDGFELTRFGFNGVQAVPADYDGDGKADLAVFHAASGQWYILQTAGEFLSFKFGFNGVVPVPHDYDGDGEDDVAVFHAASGLWYQLQSQDGFITTQFGFPGVQPAPADYDNDGKSDVSVYDANGRTWYIQASTDGFSVHSL